MGKTSKWIKNFLTGKKDKHTVQESLSPPTSAAPTTPKEKRRWSFRRSSATATATTTTTPIPTTITNSVDKISTASPSSVHEQDNYEQKKRAMDIAIANAAAANTAAAAAAAVVKHAAATKIQSVFRSYLARRALIALKGLVKLQALVRGHLVRKRATATLRCMQALVSVQARACARRRRSNDEINSYYGWPPSDLSEEHIKIVEMDTRSTRKSHSKERSSIPISPAPSEPCPRDYSEDFSFGTAQSSPNIKPDYAESMYEFPNYMANTQSSRAKVRSHSAPKQRPSDCSSVYERQSSSVTRRRPSLEGRNVPRAVRMQRSSSNTGVGAQNYQYPWSVKLDKSTASLIGSECGSTSTVLTNVNYCRSLVGFETHQRNEY